MQIGSHKVTIDTTGGAGAATGEGSTPIINGFLLDISFQFHASAPATTDVVVTAPASNDETTLAQAILTLTNTNTNQPPISPRKGTVDNANAALAGQNEPFPLNGRLKIAVAQSNALTGCVIARVRYLSL
jgi:hypothetical protein